MALLSPSAMDDSDWPAVVEYDTVFVPTRRLSVSALARTPPAWAVPSTLAWDAADRCARPAVAPPPPRAGRVPPVPPRPPRTPPFLLVLVAPCLNSADTE